LLSSLTDNKLPAAKLPELNHLEKDPGIWKDQESFGNAAAPAHAAMVPASSLAPEIQKPTT